MIKILILIILLFYLKSLIQISFLIHFPFFQFIPNILLIFVILINLFEESENPLGIYSAIFAGFFADVFSSYFFGFYILICLAISIFIKILLKNYLRLPNLN